MLSVTKQDRVFSLPFFLNSTISPIICLSGFRIHDGTGSVEPLTLIVWQL